jgi:hypothetical protein
MLRFDGFELDCDFFSGCHIRPKVDVTKRTAADLAA